MKAKIFYLLSFIFLGISVNAQNSKNEEMDHLRQEFQQHIILWKEAYNSKDAKNMVAFYSEDASYISSHVEGLEANGRERLIANFQRGMSMGGHIDTIELLSMNVSCDQASLLCKYHATNSGVVAVGRNLLVLRKVDGKWLIVLHMTVV